MIAYLWNVAGNENALPIDALVQEMNDGGMGSLLFVSAKPKRSYGAEMSSCSFRDSDGVEVVAGLILDEDGDLYTLDLWKVDFSPLLLIPSASSFFDKRVTS